MNVQLPQRVFFQIIQVQVTVIKVLIQDALLDQKPGQSFADTVKQNLQIGFARCINTIYSIRLLFLSASLSFFNAPLIELNAFQR